MHYIAYPCAWFYFPPVSGAKHSNPLYIYLVIHFPQNASPLPSYRIASIGRGDVPHAGIGQLSSHCQKQGMHYIAYPCAWFYFPPVSGAKHSNPLYIYLVIHFPQNASPLPSYRIASIGRGDVPHAGLGQLSPQCR